ncbi:hypothetical protein [Solibacillus ferritrahens]|uniref:hypothetical protein n=1 Tax=Solibacillus ferritrahens TaxID=3098620 RepID=UPI00300A03C5
MDYKEDLKEYDSSLKDFWNPTKTKLVQFIVDNNQYYYVLLPIDVNMTEMYEVNLLDVK